MLIAKKRTKGLVPTLEAFLQLPSADLETPFRQCSVDAKARLTSPDAGRVAQLQKLLTCSSKKLHAEVERAPLAPTISACVSVDAFSELCCSVCCKRFSSDEARRQALGSLLMTCAVYVENGRLQVKYISQLCSEPIELLAVTRSTKLLLSTVSVDEARVSLFDGTGKRVLLKDVCKPSM